MGRSHSLLRRSARRGAQSGKVHCRAGAGEFMKLLELQKRMAADVMRPLTSSDHIAPKTGADYVKPNDRLTSRDRLEIYNRQYWFRVIDSMPEHFPALSPIVPPPPFSPPAPALVSYF